MSSGKTADEGLSMLEECQKKESWWEFAYGDRVLEIEIDRLIDNEGIITIPGKLQH